MINSPENMKNQSLQRRFEMRDDTLLKAEGRVKLQLKGNVMHQRGFLILYECLALLRSFHVQCHIKPLAQGAASRRRSLPPAFGERLGDFNATNTRAVCNVEDKTTGADNMPMLINRVFPVESGKSDHR